MKRSLRRLLRNKRGDAAVEFISMALLMILLFATLITGLIYVTKYYNASYVCRRIVREIETNGEYDEGLAVSRADALGVNTTVSCAAKNGAVLGSGAKLQLLDEFTVTLHTQYIITICDLGSNSIDIPMPIDVSMSGMSEVYQK